MAAGLIGAVLALAAPGAQAACTDTPQPGVDWQRCLLDNRNFVDVDLAGATLRDGFFARSDLTRADFSALTPGAPSSPIPSWWRRAGPARA